MENDASRVIKLNDLFQISGWQHKLPWKPFKPGVEIYRLYQEGDNGPTAALLRFKPGGHVPLHEHTGWEHIFVLSGSQVDENARAETGMLIINPPGTKPQHSQRERLHRARDLREAGEVPRRSC